MKSATSLTKPTMRSRKCSSCSQAMRAHSTELSWTRAWKESSSQAAKQSLKWWWGTLSMVFLTRCVSWANTGRNSRMIGVWPHRTSPSRFPIPTNLRPSTRQSISVKTNTPKFQPKPKPNLKSPIKLTKPASCQINKPASLINNSALMKLTRIKEPRWADRRQ